MSKIIPATHHRLITGRGNEAAAWVRDQLGIKPELVNRVVITLDVDDAVTADVRMYLTDEMLAAFDTDLASRPGFTDGQATCLHCGDKVPLDQIKQHFKEAHKPTPPPPLAGDTIDEARFG